VHSQAWVAPLSLGWRRAPSPGPGWPGMGYVPRVSVMLVVRSGGRSRSQRSWRPAPTTTAQQTPQNAHLTMPSTTAYSRGLQKTYLPRCRPQRHSSRTLSTRSHAETSARDGERRGGAYASAIEAAAVGGESLHGLAVPERRQEHGGSKGVATLGHGLRAPFHSHSLVLFIEGVQVLRANCRKPRLSLSG